MRLFQFSTWFLLTSHAVCLVPRLKTASEGWDITQTRHGVTYSRARPLSFPSLDAATTRTSRLRPLRGPTSGRSTISAVSRLHSARAWNGSVSPVAVIGGYSAQYAVECTWDDTHIWLLFDTGSADTWAPNRKFECLGSTGDVVHPSKCSIGPEGFDDFRYGPVDEVHLFSEYASGETVSGPMGYVDLSCGGIEVYKQQVGLVNSTYWHGNNITSGILGLAYPSITKGFYGQVGEEAIWNTAPYTPWFRKATMQGLLAPMFSVALQRNSSEGVIAWGGLPQDVAWQPGSGVSTDLIVANVAGGAGTAWDYSFYTIIVDGMKWGDTYDTTKYPYLVDTGSTLIYLPPRRSQTLDASGRVGTGPALAESIAMSFDPRATYLYEWDAYYAPCDSVPPVFGVVINGKTLYIRPNDLIFQDVVDPITGFCAVALTTGGMGPYILGDVFLQSVVAVFDVGGAEMRFYSRFYAEDAREASG